MIRVRLLRALRGSHGLTNADLARVLGIPRASARRIIGELRAYHVNVAIVSGFYTLKGE